jgi:aryl-alcohol dehydrogenase-like predicted oxidoreductase
LKDLAIRDEVVIATKVHGKMHDRPNGAGLSQSPSIQVAFGRSRNRFWRI